MRAYAAAAVHELQKQAQDAPVPRTFMLRFLLAYCINETSNNIQARQIWEEAPKPLNGGQLNADDFGRSQTLNNACGCMIRSLGYEPPRM